MFQNITAAPSDPILGLTEAFQNDSRPQKINLGVGIYKDAQGKTPILASVKAAEQRIWQSETSKDYLGIPGSPKYAQAVQELLFGGQHEIVSSGRSATAHSPGGTGALRVAGDLIKTMFPTAKVWLSRPTWPNHPSVFAAAGVTTAEYPYFNPTANLLDLDEMLSAIDHMPPGDVILLHGGCHNPTGVDPTSEQWTKIAERVRRRELLPLVDFAYQGFGEGIESDAAGLRALCQPGAEMLVCSSFSKNFGLYNERVGALTLVAASRSEAEVMLGHVKRCVRANYSNPPAHGGSIVTTVLSDSQLRRQWETEVGQMRDRINGMRSLFVEALAAKGAKRDFSFIARQRGMFSFSGLNKEQVERLRQEHAIYIVGSGRISVAGMTESNMDPLCTAITQVL